jgi:phenylacetate-CoA ligase
MEAARDRRVRATVEHAARHVPYYRDLFRSAGVEAGDIRAAADLERLPLLTRDSVQAAGEELRTDEPGAALVPFRTTGSTAMPLTVYHDHASLLENIAHSERERGVEARLIGARYRYRVLELRAVAGTVGRVQAFYGQNSFRPFRPDRRMLAVDTPLERVLDAVDRFRPHVLRSYGGYLELLFRFAAVSGRLRHRPCVVLYSGDVMSEVGRALIEQQFGIPVLSLYNAVECFKIGFTCERRHGFHLHDDLCHVRLVNADGDAVHDGEKGEVVISNLVNRGTVLLNYRLGDVARIERAPCDCGRTSRRLVELEGRVDDFLDLGDNIFVYPTQVWEPFRSRPEILRYQLVQRAPRRFELRVVLSDASAGARAAEEAAGELRAILHSADVEVHPHDELPAEQGGKFRHLVPLHGD